MRRCGATGRSRGRASGTDTRRGSGAAAGSVEAVQRVDLGGQARTDDRGWTLDPLGAAALAHERLGDLHLVSLGPGAVRGNHYHPRSTEWMLICGGPARLAWRPAHAAGEVREVTVDGAGPALLCIPPRVAHALVNLGDRPIHALCFSDGPAPETVPCDPPLL